MERHFGQHSVTNCRCDVGLLVRCFHLRSSNINVSTFEDRCRLSNIDVLTFGDRHVDLRRSMIDVSTFEDQ